MITAYDCSEFEFYAVQKLNAHYKIAHHFRQRSNNLVQYITPSIIRTSIIRTIDYLDYVPGIGNGIT